MRRGEVWWANLPPPIGTRSVVLLSRNAAYWVKPSITVAVITRTVRNIPVEVPLEPEDDMTEKCVANLDDIMTIPKSLLTERVTVLSRTKMTSVARAIIFALDLRQEER